MSEIIIGVDFDNTIVSYHDAFHAVAVEKNLITSSFPKNKEAIRNYLIKCGKENEWTEMQGYVYGRALCYAQPFPGVIEFFDNLHRNNIQVYIISHKTKYPYLGIRYDLHQAANLWIEKMQLNPAEVFFMESKQEKLLKISTCCCTYFIDDLQEILTDQNFPLNTHKILFSPNETQEDLYDNLSIFKTWNEILKFIGRQLCMI